jgi:ketosteroid isomerase-like protein
VLVGITVFAPVYATAASVKPALPCASDKAALRAMLEAEYAFGQEARSSMRSAFLDYLAHDSWVLRPSPQPGRAFYAAAKESKNLLEWYPAVGDIAAGGDLGFTAGPWVYTDANGGTQTNGHFLTVWKRDAQCRWRVELDGGVTQGAPAAVEPKLLPDQLTYTKPALPPPQFVADDAASQALSEFQVTAQQDGFAAALRTYGRNGDFHFYTDDEASLDGAAAATEYLIAHPIVGGWKEDVRGRSADSTLEYSAGQLTDSHNQGTHAYIQIWQYDPKVANWGLRILLITRLQ